jgi:hypothetical protein
VGRKGVLSSVLFTAGYDGSVPAASAKYMRVLLLLPLPLLLPLHSDLPAGLSGIFFHLFFNRLEVSRVIFQQCASHHSGHKKNGISVFMDSEWPQGPVF